MPSSSFDFGEGGADPLWREPAFGFTLAGFGLAAALLPIAVSPAPGAWPGAALVLLVLLAIADLGASERSLGMRRGAFQSLRFAAGAAVVPTLLGLAAAAAGMGPGGRVALLLLGLGALFSLAAIAPLEVAPPPDEDGTRSGRSRATLAAGASLSFVTAPFAVPYVESAVGRLGSDPNVGEWWLAALALTLCCGVLVAAAGWVGATLLRQLHYRSFRAPRAAAAALLLAASGGIAAAGWAWF